MRRRILVVASWYPTASDPVAGVFVHRQVEALGRLHEVAVLAPILIPPGGRPARQLRPPEPLARVWQPSLTIRIPRRITWSPTAWGYLRVLRRSYEVIAAEWGTPDVIHAHVALLAGWGAVSLGRDIGRPVVLTEHTGPFAANLHNRSARSLTRVALAGAQRVIAVSPGLKADILGFMPALDVSVVGNVVDTDYFTLPPSPRGRTSVTSFLFVGSLTHVKGPDLLLGAAAAVRSSGAGPFTVTIVGDGPLRADLEHQVQVLELQAQVRFLGALESSMLRLEYWNADALVSTSRHETFGVVLAEALAAGTPVIATRTDGAEFVIPDGAGMIVDPTVASIAEAMRNFMANPLSVESSSLHASVERRFSPSVVADALSSIYESVVARG